MPSLSGKNVAAAEWKAQDPKTSAENVLTLTFVKTGAIYIYYPVPKAVYQGLIQSDNPDQYFVDYIKGRYSYQRKA